MKENGYQGIGFTCGGFFSQLSIKSIQYYPQWMDRFNFRFLYRFYKEKHTRKRYLKATFLFPFYFIKIKFVKSLFRFHLIAGRAFCLGVELGSSSLLFSRELDFGRYNERLLSVFWFDVHLCSFRGILYRAKKEKTKGRPSQSPLPLQPKFLLQPLDRTYTHSLGTGYHLHRITLAE